MAYFTVSEARAVKPLDNTTTYPDAKIEEMRAIVEESIEDACGVAFEPRTTTEIFNGSGLTGLLPSWPRVRTVTAVSVDGTAYTAAQLLDVEIESTGLLYYASGWTSGHANVSVTYTHGYTTPPKRVKRAALLLTKAWLISGPVDDRATSQSTEDGTFLLATPGMRGSVFGIPEVDATIKMYGGYREAVA